MRTARLLPVSPSMRAVITKKHSSRMHTARFFDSGRGGGLPTETLWTETPSGRNMGPGTETPLKGTWDQSARQDVTSYETPPVDRMTYRCF